MKKVISYPGHATMYKSKFKKFNSNKWIDAILSLSWDDSATWNEYNIELIK